MPQSWRLWKSHYEIALRVQVKITSLISSRLTAGPSSRAIRELVKVFKKMDKYGISKDRIVNSSLEKLLSFLIDERGKNTENLLNLRKSSLEESEGSEASV